MDRKALNITGIEVIFDYLITQPDTVFWISRNNFTQQVYLSKTFNELWGRPRDLLFDNPVEWSTTLCDEDKERTMKACALRLDPATFKEGQCLLYKIVKPNNKIACIKDVCFQLVNETQNISCLAGISKKVKPPEYDILQDLPYEQRYCLDQEGQTELSQVLTNTLKLDLNICDHSPSKKHHYQIITKHQTIQLSPRLAQCLYLLHKGLHTKQIANLMGLTLNSVKIYIERLREKLGAKNRIEMFSKIINLYHIETWNFPVENART